MLDLSGYNDRELEILVFNDEGLYVVRHQADLFELLDEMFVYTPLQKELLVEALEADREEMEEWASTSH